MRQSIVRVAAAVLVLTLTLVAVGCGGSDEAATPGAAATAAAPSAAVAGTTPAAPSGAAITTPSGPQVIEIRAGEEGSSFYMQPNEATVRPGAVTITLANAGPTRPHNVVVRTKSGDGDLAKSATVNPGGSTSLEFTVTEAGAYEMYCTLPGHKDRGAKGSLTVLPF